MIVVAVVVLRNYLLNRNLIPSQIWQGNYYVNKDYLKHGSRQLEIKSIFVHLEALWFNAVSFQLRLEAPFNSFKKKVGTYIS